MHISGKGGATAASPDVPTSFVRSRESNPELSRPHHEFLRGMNSDKIDGIARMCVPKTHITRMSVNHSFTKYQCHLSETSIQRS